MRLRSAAERSRPISIVAALAQLSFYKIFVRAQGRGGQTTLNGGDSGIGVGRMRPLELPAAQALAFKS